MAAAKEFGDANYEKLDTLTVSMPHPDAMTALLSGGVTAHFSSPPFEYQERAKGMRVVTSNYEILGGPATFNVVWATSKFKSDNPKTYDAFVAALEEATEAITKDKTAAAKTYKRMSKTAETEEELIKELSDPQVTFTLEPHKTLKTAEFMHRIGRIKVKPASWKDLYFQNLHGLHGS
jgi:NitT/TauT family transport system substrate-binding protein